MAKRSQVLIRYRSGQMQEVSCDSLSVEFDTNTGEVRSMEWENMSPTPLFLDVRAIESVWEVL